ncbi:head maturation protease, ClpP-related [Clostridium perfringens]|uniref:head maturation protease, ClpP-related n=1 Tax=Clostridium perfringens TaxID=1502 RepID=UPI00233FCEC1|nr:head maturation protease, ClpP-related [Clostridium perfringens]MDC4245521.1 ATP-dependent Clp protease proteolytic subunit [Clostridium perfringens]
MAKRKFYEFKNIANKDSELYVYGEICNGIDKWDETDVTFKDFKDTLENMVQGSTLNMYINSPGGSVFTTQSIIAMLRRAKENGIKINAYIDGLAASCASWLPMVADEVFVYPQSIMMIHKPLCGVWGNADEMRKEIEVLDKIENDVIVPLYIEKAKEGVTEDILKEQMAKETWLNSNEMSEMFNVTLLEDERKIVCWADKDIFNKYTNVPEELLKMANKEEEGEKTPIEPEKVEDENIKKLEDKISNLEGEVENLNKEKENLVKEKEEVSDKLNQANEKIIALNEEITSMKPLVDEYNKKLEEEKAKLEEEKLEELTNEYEKKFNSLGASKKFKSEEVQNLLKESIKDESKKNELNSMIVDLITIKNDNKNKLKSIDNSVDMDNLIPDNENGASKYGFK